jgi:outer membrane protein OmpA-like peptidoglycan-associated protein
MTVRRRGWPGKAPRVRGFAILALGLGVLGVVGGCGRLLDSVPPRPAAIDDPAVAEAPFPRLAEVPARPRLGYTLEQRRAIAEGLVADRDNARHQGDELRRATGRPALPPAPPLPAQEPPRASPPPDPAADLAIAYVEDSLARDADDGSLGDFLDGLERLPPGIDAAVVQAGVAAMPPLEGMPGAGGLPLHVVFPHGSAALGPDAEERLRAAGAALREATGPVVVSAGGARAGPGELATAGLAMQRAQRVAAVLVAAGLDAGRISFDAGGEMGGDGDEVIVYQPDGGSG